MAIVVLTTDGANLISNILLGIDTGIVKYVALGSGTSTPSSGQHTLDNETFRKAVTAITKGINPGELLITLYLGAGDAIGSDIEEVAFFGGQSASPTKDSGIMLARGLYSRNPKTINDAIQFNLDVLPSF